MNYINCPFQDKELYDISETCYNTVKGDKRLQYLDTKFRIIQAMIWFLKTHQSFTLKFYETSYTGLFLNLIVCGINEHDVYLSYSLRRKNANFVLTPYQTKEITITHVSYGMQHDENTIPELDQLYT